MLVAVVSLAVGGVAAPLRAIVRLHGACTPWPLAAIIKGLQQGVTLPGLQYVLG